MIKTPFTYLNSTPDNSFVITPPVLKNNILSVRRNGYGLKIIDTTGLTATVNVTANEYRAKQAKDGFILPVGKHIIELFRTVTVGYVQHGFEIGPTITVGDKYVFSAAGVDVTHTVVGGDTHNTIRNSLSAQIDAAIYPFPVGASALPGTGQFLVQMDNPAYIMIGDIITPGRYLFQTGYYCELPVLETVYDYILHSASNDMGYPSLPALSASYNYNLITQAPAGIINWLFTPNYTQLSFSAPIEATTNINNVPTGSVAPASDVIYDEVNSKMIFPFPLAVGEYIKMLYK